MRSIIAAAALLVAVNGECQTELINYLWILAPTEANLDETCATDNGKATFDALETVIASECGGSDTLKDTFGLVGRIACLKEDDNYCMPTFSAIIPPLMELIGSLTAGGDLDVTGFLADPAKVLLASSNSKCNRRIIGYTTQAARRVAKANNFDLTEEISYLHDINQAMMMAAAKDTDDKACAELRATLITADGSIDRTVACVGGEWKPCARRLVSTYDNTPGLAVREPNFCSSTKTIENIGEAKLKLANVLFSYYDALDDTMKAKVDTYILKDLSALIGGFLISNLEITISKAADESVSVSIVFKGYEIEYELMEQVKMIKSIIDAGDADLLTCTNLETFLPDAAFADVALLESGNGAGVEFEEMTVEEDPEPEVTPEDDTTDDTASSATMLAAGMSALLILAPLL